MNGKNFRNDLQLAIYGLETAVTQLADREASLQMEYTGKIGKRAEALRRHAESLLPDLEVQTLDELRREVPEFSQKTSVRAVFAKAERMPVTLWTKITGNTASYRVKELSNELYMLQTQLAAYLDMIEEKPYWLRDVSTIVTATDGLKQALADLKQNKARAEAQLDSLKRTYAAFAKDPNLAPSDEFRKKIGAAAEKMSRVQNNARRYRYDPKDPSMTPPDHDDYSGLLFYMLTGIPTDGTTFMLWALSDNSASYAEQSGYLGADGGFGGAGADQSWNDPGQSTAYPQDVGGDADSSGYPQDNAGGNSGETSFGSLS